MTPKSDIPLVTFWNLGLTPISDQGLLFRKIAEICLKTLTKIPKIAKTTKKVLTLLSKHKKIRISRVSTRKLTKS